MTSDQDEPTTLDTEADTAGQITAAVTQLRLEEPKAEFNDPIPALLA